MNIYFLLFITSILHYCCILGSFGRVVRAQLIAKNPDGTLLTTEDTVVKMIRRKGGKYHPSRLVN